jgi:hypothetical protein
MCCPESASAYEGAMEGGGNPSTQYLVTYLSRKFEMVYVMRDKMPTYPNTYAGANGQGLEVMPEAQTQYWSLVSCEAPPEPSNIPPYFPWFGCLCTRSYPCTCPRVNIVIAALLNLAHAQHDAFRPQI